MRDTDDFRIILAEVYKLDGTLISRTFKLLIFISPDLFHLAAFKLVKRTNKSDNIDYFTKCPVKGKL